MLRDENPTVVSSALAGLMDIWERSENIKLTIDYASASKIVQILPDCSEWGQTYILEAMMNYVPQDTSEAALLAERISPRLSHNALLILQRRPEVLRNDIRVFFCKYNDPIYVKVTKLELIFMLATERNIKEVLTELSE